MHLLIIAAALSVASAQTSTAAGTITSAATSARSTGTSSSAPVTHTVQVAKGNHAFNPDIIVALPGDVIEYEFYPTNHSVIRAEYGYPCVPYELVNGAGHYGFYSGPKPVDVVLDDPPVWRLTVNDSDPVFFYCGAPGSCNGWAMVGVINPNANTSLEHQKDLAKQADFVLLPGQDWPDESDGASATSVAGGSSRTSSAPAIATSTASTLPSSTPAPSHGLGAGAIAGIAIGGSAVLLAAFVAIWFCGRQSRRGQIPAPVAPPQEIHQGYHSGVHSMYGKPGHMSVVSGYSMPPGYEHHGMQSPQMSHTPIDPAMMHAAGVSPHLRSVSPAYGQQPMPNMYAAGTHQVAPVEMPSTSNGPSSPGPTSPRRSTDKSGPGGVERYG